MAESILSIVETAYRATLEEQDDPIIWLAHSLRASGAATHLLLRGNAVNYGVRDQDASGLRFGSRAQTQPPRIDRDLLSLIEKGGEVFYIQDDAAIRGIQPDEVIPGLKAIKATELPALFRRFDRVWHW
jgi:hypothetical protein